MQKNVGDHERGAGKRAGSDKTICSLRSSDAELVERKILKVMQIPEAQPH